jgi:hypothetical protein
MVIFKGKVKGKSPNMIDALSYHTEYWKRTPPVVKNDDIPYEEAGWDEDERPIANMPKHGLSCPTRRRFRR